MTERGALPSPVISTERSERRNPAGDGRRADAGACGVDGAPSGFLPFGFAQGRLLRPGPMGRASGRNDGRGGAPPSPVISGEAQHPTVISTERNTQPVISTEAERVEKSGRRRAPGGRRSLRRRWSALRVSPLRACRRSGRNDGRGRFPPRHFDRSEAACPERSRRERRNLKRVRFYRNRRCNPGLFRGRHGSVQSGYALTRISHRSHDLRGAVGPAGQESRAARCGDIGQAA